MRFEVLGPLRALAPVQAGAGGSPTGERPLGGPKQQLVLALLLAHPNMPVSVERLIDGVWGESPPESARHTLQSYVSELRKTLGEIVERGGAGYSIRVDRTGLDALDFEARASDARARLADDPVAATAELEAALAMWRGRPYEDFPEQPILQAEAVRLDELRLGAAEAVLGARLAAGDHVSAIAGLERLTREHPYREELRALQMLALYRAGRQADALRAFQATRAVLADELGIDPSPRLRRLEEQILLQDPDLDPNNAASSGREAARARLENPFLGLRPFREADASRFFGRDHLIAQLISRVADRRTFTAVVGPSGSGKSSAVQAGLIPQVREHLPEAVVALLQPGLHPFTELEAALSPWGVGEGAAATITDLRASDAGLLDAATRLVAAPRCLLLVVDQFEELFTLTEPDEAQAFIAALVRASRDPERRVQVLVTMRADFYDRPLADPSLGSLFAENVVNVVPMDPDELEAAATLPARQLDVRVEPRLVARLVADVAGQPNALPLFQYALTELFDERTGPELDVATYDRVGGVRTAVARRAESLYTHLDPSEQHAVRQLFLRIATVAGAVVGRRRVPASELTALDVDVVALQSAIDAFARYRLLVLDRDPSSGAPTVEVAHEALLGEWHRLRDWIEESREDLATHARFAVAVSEWEAVGRDAGYLLTGSRLDDYQRWAAASRLKLTEAERAFIDLALQARTARNVEDEERDIAAARLRRRSRRQLAVLGVAAALLAAVIAYPILAADDPPGQLAVALDAPRSEGAFEELIARGVEEAAQDHGLEAVVLEPPYTDVADAESTLADDADLVFGSFLMWDDMVTAAADHPDTTWVFLDFVDPPQVHNGVAVSFAHEDGSFLVGAAAALESKTGRIGYIGANMSEGLIEEFRAGFEQGAKAVRPDVEIVASVISRNDRQAGYQNPEEARALAEWMYGDEGVDVIYTAAGESGQGVIEAATDLSEPLGRHLWAIGVDTDLLYQLPAAQREHVLTSMVKRLDVGIEQVVSAHLDGTLEVPSTVRVGLKEDAVGYSTSGNHLSPATIERLDELSADVKSGAIHVSDVPTGELREPPPPPVAPDSVASRAALDVTNRYFEAVQAGDVDGAMHLLSADPYLTLFGPWTRDQWGNLLIWDEQDRPLYRDVECTPRLPVTGLRVDCIFLLQPGLNQRIGAPPVHMGASFTVARGAIAVLEVAAIGPDFSTTDEPFGEWMREHHPDAAKEAACCGGDTPEEAARNGQARARYADEWAAYLRENGCDWDEGC